MTYNLNINNRAFNAILAGTKKVEIRVTTNHNKIDYNQLRKTDILIFNDELGQKLRCIITDMRWYKTAQALLLSEGIQHTLSSTNNVEDGIKRIESFKNYKEGIKKNGVNAIHVKVISQSNME